MEFEVVTLAPFFIWVSVVFFGGSHYTAWPIGATQYVVRLSVPTVTDCHR